MGTTLKQFSILIITCLLVSGGCISTQINRKLQLASKGKSLVEIAIAENATKAEKLACDELREHLRKIVGMEFNVVEESKIKKGGRAIYLGQTKFASQNGVDYSMVDEEEMVVKSVEGNLIITGGRPRGTLYAVYAFLERHTGCHWLAWDTSIIPNKPNLTISSEINFKLKPAFSPRDIHICISRLGGGEKKRKYEIFSRRNFAQEVWNAEIGGSLSYTAAYPHSFYLFIDPKKLFDKHPEYFTMNAKGKRTYGTPLDTPGGAGSELCLSNPELPKVMADSVLKYLREQDTMLAPKKLKPSIVDITQEDNAKFICKCPKCSAISQSDGPGESALLIRFVNKVANLIAQKRPEVKIRTLAYTNTDIAPKNVKARDNVIVQWCDLYGFSDLHHPLSHPVNKRQLERLMEWKKVAKQIHIWDYWIMGSQLSKPSVPDFRPVRTIAADNRLFKKCNVSGVFLQFEKGVTSQNFYTLDIWAGMQLMVDTTLEPNHLVNTFMTGYYGNAAQPVRRFYDMLEQAFMDEKEPMFTLPGPPQRAYINMDFLIRCRNILLQAEAATAPASLERIHVWEEMVVVYNCLLNRWNKLKQAHNRDFPFSKDEILNKYNVIREAVLDHWSSPGKRRDLLREDLKNEMRCLSGSFPLPEQFKDVPSDQIIDLPYPKLSSWLIKDDPDALGGKAVGYYIPQRDNPEGPPKFGVYDRASKRSGPTLTITNIPQDEKYHLYKLGTFTIGRETIVWGHWSWWLTCANLASEYAPADGLEGTPNQWTIYLSIKATGPLYVKNSKSKNALWCDRIILVKPNSSMKKTPKQI